MYCIIHITSHKEGMTHTDVFHIFWLSQGLRGLQWVTKKEKKIYIIHIQKTYLSCIAP